MEILCASNGGEPPMCGAAGASFGPDDDPAPAVEFAVQAARRTRNPIYALPAPSELPDVPLADPAITSNASGVVESLHGRLQAVADKDRSARLTLAEWFVETEEKRLVNSRGIDARQIATEANLEWIVLVGEGTGRVETVLDLTRRRVSDVDVEAEWAEVAGQTVDRHEASAAPTYEGPVVLRGKAVSTFLNSGVFETMASGRARFGKISDWEIGKLILRREVQGDPLNLWATRLLPFGTHAGRFDSEGIPGQRVALIQENRLAAFSAGQRYATYLEVPATGAFGDIELPPGSSPAASLVSDPHVEVAQWSWFSPNPTTGDFAAEIRLGYIVDGTRRPFTGGLLVGNVLDALADVRWSSETDFYGDFQGPTTGRFASLKVVPSRED